MRSFALAWAVCIWIPLSVHGVVQIVEGTLVELPENTDPKAIEFFETKIRPVLVENCYECHGANSQKLGGSLDLTTPTALTAGGGRGLAVSPGFPQESMIIEAIRYSNQDLQMPPDGQKLPDQVIEDFIQWIKDGAVDPRQDDPGGAATQDLDGANFDYTPFRDHWAYQAVGDYPPPAVKNKTWASNEIDQFILARLEEEGLSPSPAADKRTLIRRATFDLIGLPATADDIDDFLADDSPDAYAKVIDRLLASEHYGERWARYWLDIMRYADSNGVDENIGFPYAWRYRDYVVNSLNKDKPYDLFVTEQLAGDLMADPKNDAERYERLTATGFMVMGPKILAEPDFIKKKTDIVDEQLSVAVGAFMAQTVGCARCHDHKFDPIPAYDYYALAGVFSSTEVMTSYLQVRDVLELELADEETVAAFKKHGEDLTQAKKELTEFTAEANSTFQARWREDLAKYLLAATGLLDDIPPREAEDFSAANLEVDIQASGIGVLTSAADIDQSFVEWKVQTPAAGNYRVLFRYTTRRQALPVKMFLNGTLLKERVANKVARTQKWLDQGVFPFPAGENLLRLETKGAFPHLDQFLIIGADEDSAYQLKSAGLIERYAIQGAVLQQWVSYLRNPEGLNTLTSPTGTRLEDSAFTVWRRFAELRRLQPENFSKAAQELVNELLQEIKENPLSFSSPTVSILSGLAPTSLEEVAGRYQTLFAAVDAAYQRRLERLKDKKEFVLVNADPVPVTSLEDLSLDRLRQVLYNADGPFAFPKSAESLYDKDTGDQIAQLRDRVKEFEDNTPAPIPKAMAVMDTEIVDLPIHLRGSHLSLGPEPVPRGFLRVADHVLTPPAIDPEHSGRLELAQWLTHADHPLTSRVMINRIWQGHFGLGLVATPSNFGTRGAQPSHPQLLDYLAKEFMSQDWSIKQMHRLMMLSSTYRMQSTYDSQKAEKDPANKFYWRMPRKRLEAEPIRDAVLAMGNSLDLTLGGGLFPTTGGYVRGGKGLEDAFKSNRRAIYLPIIRSMAYPMFTVFDYTDAASPIPHRSSSTVASQALFMMNSKEVLKNAEWFAESLLADETLSTANRLEVAYIKAYARPPQANEIEWAQEFLDQQMRTHAATGADPAGVEHYAWTNLCQVVMAANEFIYVN